MIGKFTSVVLLLLFAGSVFAAEPLVKDAVFVAFDTETTGFGPQKNRVVEIGAVKFRGDGTVLGSTNWLVNPEREVPYYATNVHGITTQMAAEAPLFEQVWPLFVEFCGDADLFAHNAPFDVGFVNAELCRAGIETPHMRVFDTLTLFRKWFPEAPSHSLGKLTVYLNVLGDTYHRAEADAFHIVTIFKLGLKQRVDITMLQMKQDAGTIKRIDGSFCP